MEHIQIYIDGKTKKQIRQELRRRLVQMDRMHEAEKEIQKQYIEYKKRCTCNKKWGITCKACCEYPSTITGIYR